MLKTILFIISLSSLSLAVVPVLKTGQTKSYDVVGNVVTDDGYHQARKAHLCSNNRGIVSNSIKKEDKDA